MCPQLLQSYLTLGDPVDCSPPGPSVPGILQARTLVWLPCPPPGGVFLAQGSSLCLLPPTRTTWEAQNPSSVWLYLDPISQSSGHLGTSHFCLWKHLFYFQPEVEVLMHVSSSWTLKLEDRWLPRLPVCFSLADRRGFMLCLQLLPFRHLLIKLFNFTFSRLTENKKRKKILVCGYSRVF